MPIVLKKIRTRLQTGKHIMIAKFISLLVLLIIIAALIYVAISDVTIPQTERIVKVTPQVAQEQTVTTEESSAE